MATPATLSDPRVEAALCPASAGPPPTAWFEYGVPKAGQGGVVMAGCLLTALFVAAGCASSKPAAGRAVQRPAGGASVFPQARTKEMQAAISPEQALAALRAGNARFVAGHRQPRDLRTSIRAAAAGQHPFAVILSCADSRLPTEIVFDQGIGDVFSVRVAGNVLNGDVLASLEFACKSSGAKLIVVLGHSNCGLIKGAIDGVEAGSLTPLLARIKPAVALVPAEAGSRTSRNDEFVQRVAEANVRLVLRQIREQSPILREMLEVRRIGLAGGMYDLETGGVQFFPD